MDGLKLGGAPCSCGVGGREGGGGGWPGQEGLKLWGDPARMGAGRKRGRGAGLL